MTPKPKIDDLLTATNQYGIEVRRAFNGDTAKLTENYLLAINNFKEALANLGLADYFDWSH